MSLSNPINPAGVVGSFMATLPPMSSLDATSSRGRRGSITEQIHEHARKGGYDQGYAEGLLVGRQEAYDEAQLVTSQEIQRFVSELDRSAALMKAAVEQWQAGLQQPLLGLAVVIATQILGRELALDPDAIIDIARQAVGEVNHADAARIRVNPFLGETVRARKSEILAASVSLRSLEVVDDPNVIAGCVIESEGGTVDAQIDAMLANALSTLRGDV